MRVLESVEQRMPRSVVRHRPLETHLPPGYHPTVARASRVRASSTVGIGVGTPFMASVSASAKKRPIPPDDTADLDLDDLSGSYILSETSIPYQRPMRTRRSVHPLVSLGFGMLAMLLIWIALIHVVNWVQLTLDDLRYGRPRVFQLDAVVGHHDSKANPTHLLAINLGGQVEVIEWPGGDASHARISLGPHLFGQGAELAPVTLQVVDVNDDHHPDLVLHFQGSAMVLINEQDS